MHGLIDEAVHDELHQGQHHGQEQDRVVAANVQNFLPENRQERAHHWAPVRRAAAASSVSVTNTSSREGAISRSCARSKPACARCSRSSSSPKLRSTTACTAWPNIVAPLQYGCCCSHA